MTRSQNLLTAIGVTTLLVYLTTSTGLVDGDNKLILALAFGIAPMAIVGVLGVFNRFVSIFGVVSAGALLVLNLFAFPNVPKESRLVDLGPVTGIWWLMVISQIVRFRWRTRVHPVAA